MKRRGASSIAANPVLIGAATTLVVVVAMFLSYNANQGLPFVPTYELKVEAPDAARLVKGNEVREGGQRIGLISEIEPVRRRPGGPVAAELTLKLDEEAGPVPADSRIVIRPRSALGLKYIDLVRGTSSRTLGTGGVLVAGEDSIATELDDVLSTFTDRTRANIQENLNFGGGAFVGRGQDVNRALVGLPPLLTAIVRPMQTLSDPSTRLRPAVRQLADLTTLLRPLAPTMAQGFADGAEALAGFTDAPGALQETIEESPPTIDVALRTLDDTRPLLRELVDVSDDLRLTAREVRRSSSPIADALEDGTRTLRQVPPLADDLERVFDATDDLASSPTTIPALRGLEGTGTTLRPTLRWLGPHVTVCNYFNYMWAFTADSFSEEDGQTGTLLRVAAKNAPPLQENSLAEFAADKPVQATTPSDPVTEGIAGDAAEIHAQPYGRAVDENGDADCEQVQRGYPERLAKGGPPDLRGAVDPRTPGNQGPTKVGRARVPEGQTFSAEPGGLAPDVANNPPNVTDGRP